MRTEDLIAKHHISNVLALHSRGVDRADAHLLGAAYHPHASVAYGFFNGPALTLVDILATAQKGALPSLHRTSNCEIHVKGEAALAESYVIAYVEDSSTQRMVYGRYLDRLEKYNGNWAITHRAYVMDSNSNYASTVMRADPPVLHDHYVPTGGKASADAGRAMMAHYEAAARHLQKAPPMTHAQHELDAALSRDAIRMLLTRYCRAADRNDAALMESVFWDDASIISGICNGPPSAFIPAVMEFIKSNLDCCFHSIANEWIEIKGDHAIGEHYIIAHNRTQNQDTLTGGRYIDSYERRNGEWRIAHRSFICDWTKTDAANFESGGFYESLSTRGTYGRADPVYAHWDSL